MTEPAADIKQGDTADVQPGEIVQDESGNVVIGAPTAEVFVYAPVPGGEE